MTAGPDRLPDGVAVGHWTDRDGWTGCTVVLPPPGSVAAAEIRGGGTGTRESELLSPAASVHGVDALLLTGGSAFGLAAAEGVVAWLAERERGYRTPVGVVPLVSAGVVFDLALGDPGARPRPGDARAACEAAGSALERGSVGAGTGCTVGNLLGPDGWCRGGLGAAGVEVEGARLTALAVVNAFGDVLDGHGEVAAGPWRDGRMWRTGELLLAGERPRTPPLENTTLVCLMTDAVLDKREAWLLARAGTAGVARAVDPVATAVDGDLVACVAGGRIRVDPLLLTALAPEVVAGAVRDAVLQATPAPGCPTAAQRKG
jgi:L-aminopeptidase/D-esterase-like protein